MFAPWRMQHTRPTAGLTTSPRVARTWCWRWLQRWHAHGHDGAVGQRSWRISSTRAEAGYGRRHQLPTRLAGVKAARGMARLPAMRSAHDDHRPFRGATIGRRNAGNRCTLGASRQARRFARRHRPRRGFPAPDGDAGGVPAGASSMAHAYGCRGRHTSRAAWRAGRGGRTRPPTPIGVCSRGELARVRSRRVLKPSAPACLDAHRGAARMSAAASRSRRVSRRGRRQTGRQRCCRWP